VANATMAQIIHAFRMSLLSSSSGAIRLNNTHGFFLSHMHASSALPRQHYASIFARSR